MDAAARVDEAPLSSASSIESTFIMFNSISVHLGLRAVQQLHRLLQRDGLRVHVLGDGGSAGVRGAGEGEGLPTRARLHQCEQSWAMRPVRVALERSQRLVAHGALCLRCMAHGAWCMQPLAPNRAPDIPPPT